MRNSLADVVAAALRALHDHGLENCSMRRVAAELGVQPSALYHHVENKQTLLALMADEIVRPVTSNFVAAGSDPAARADSDENPRTSTQAIDNTRSARELCLSLREAMLAVNDGADVVAAATAFRLGSSELERRLAEFVGPDVARTLLLYTYGHAQSTQLQRQAAAIGALAVPAASGDGPSSALEMHYETTIELDASFGRGLDIILTGSTSNEAGERIELRKI